MKFAKHAEKTLFEEYIVFSSAPFRSSLLSYHGPGVLGRTGGVTSPRQRQWENKNRANGARLANSIMRLNSGQSTLGTWPDIFDAQTVQCDLKRMISLSRFMTPFSQERKVNRQPSWDPQ